MARSGYRRHSETFTEITWREDNRQRHFEKRPIDLAIARKLNWSRIKKRKDTAHRGQPPRFNALVALDLLKPPLIFFVVYVKVAGALHIISIRQANAEERAIFNE